MVYTIPLPTKEEIISVIKYSKEYPELLDERELWILENFVGGIK